MIIYSVYGVNSVRVGQRCTVAVLDHGVIRATGCDNIALER